MNASCPKHNATTTMIDHFPTYVQGLKMPLSLIDIIDVMDVHPAAVLIPWGHIGDHRQTALGTSRLSLVPGQWKVSSNPVSARSTFQTERRWEK